MASEKGHGHTGLIETETFVKPSIAMLSVMKTPDIVRVRGGVFMRPAVGGLVRDPGE